MEKSITHDTTDILKNGGIGIIATDTIYGIVGQALNITTVERIYKLKKRHPSKPFIILIDSMADIELFGIKLFSKERDEIMQFWPGPISVILRCDNDKFSYLHRDGGTLAFRMPAKDRLRNIIKLTGPLVAPSANPEGLPPADTVKMARIYFGDKVDFYKSGKISNRASKIVQIIDGTVVVIRN